MKKLNALLAATLLSATGFAQSLQYTALDCGMQFNIALRSDSTLWGWGYNANGQVGDGLGTQIDAPQQLMPSGQWIGVATGAFHTLALSADSTLWGWGFNATGQLGTAATTDPVVPTMVASGKWRAASGGFVHSAAICADGTLWATGFNGVGQLGLGDTLDRDAWTQVGAAADWKAVSCGGYHTLALKNDGSLWAWGYNQTGQAGTGSAEVRIKTPQPVAPGAAWSMVSAGFEFSAAIRADGSLHTWGFNGNNQLGLGSGAPSTQPTPAQAGTATNWVRVAAGSSFSFGIQSDSTLWGWGFNGRGQLGLGNTTEAMEPTPAGADDSWAMIAAADGGDIGGSLYGLHAAGWKTGASNICAAGDNQAGQLGLGDAGAGVMMQDFFDCSVGAVPTGIGATAAHEEAVTIFPNPAREAIFIQATSSAMQSVSLLGMDGRVLWSGTLVQGRAVVDVRAWPQGIYLVRVHDAHGAMLLSRQVAVR